MVTLDGATIEGACGLIDVMIRALDVERFSKFSSLNKVSKVDKFADLVTEKDIYRCQHSTLYEEERCSQSEVVKCSSTISG